MDSIPIPISYASLCIKHQDTLLKNTAALLNSCNVFWLLMTTTPQVILTHSHSSHIQTLKNHVNYNSTGY
ncbi:hypothetical protein LX64_00998 [Chitinophaga skermanii]|uniref:Uncharacterized protein n=1 Tax=Chitinophaga skermanii TaxID=331697 RepID=A0A327QVE4_9BACT|nr:hypothetical protein LX64_00998 [Chitinophaga skermanii]